MKVSIYYAFSSLVKCKIFKRDSLKKKNILKESDTYHSANNFHADTV